MTSSPSSSSILIDGQVSYDKEVPRKQDQKEKIVMIDLPDLDLDASSCQDEREVPSQQKSMILCKRIGRRKKTRSCSSSLVHPSLSVMIMTFSCFVSFLVIQVSMKRVMCEPLPLKPYHRQDHSLTSDSLDSLTNRHLFLTPTSSQEKKTRKTAEVIISLHDQLPFNSRQKRSQSTFSSSIKSSSPSNNTRLSPRTVKTKYGSVRGMLLTRESFTSLDSLIDLFVKTRFPRKVSEKSNGLVEVFVGIPYSAPPVSSLRWMPPTTTGLHWKGTRTFSRFPAVCPQVFNSELDSRTKKLLSNQSEDCLYLNIYAPFPSDNALFNSSDTG